MLKKHASGGIRTHGLSLRGPKPYPLYHYVLQLHMDEARPYQKNLISKICQKLPRHLKCVSWYILQFVHIHIFYQIVAKISLKFSIKSLIEILNFDMARKIQKLFSIN